MKRCWEIPRLNFVFLIWITFLVTISHFNCLTDEWLLYFPLFTLILWNMIVRWSFWTSDWLQIILRLKQWFVVLSGSVHLRGVDYRLGLVRYFKRTFNEQSKALSLLTYSLLLFNIIYLSVFLLSLNESLSLFNTNYHAFPSVTLDGKHWPRSFSLLHNHLIISNLINYF